jgi:6-phosphogluconolactonase (cycloisomerase 2 family)
MTMKLRILLILTVALGQMFWTSCGHYSCSDTFSSNNCSTGGGGGGGIGTGGGGGGGGGSAASAFVFAIDQTLGSIDGYTLNATNSTFQATSNYVAPVIPTGDPGVGVVVVQKKFLYAVFGPENLIYGWAISSSGALSTLSGFPVSVTPTLTGTIPVTPYRQISVITNPTGTLLFVAQALFNQILVFQISSTGGLTEGPPVSTGADSPINLGMDGLGKYLYATEDPNLSTHTATKTAAYLIGSTGTLAAVPGSPFAFPMWEVQGDLSGAYLIGISGNSTALSGVDDKNIYVFTINQTTGVLTAATGSPFATTYSPFNLAVNPVGEFAYTFSLNPSDTGNNPTEGFALNQGTGAITAAPGSPFSNLFTGGNGQFEQSGAYLFSHTGDLSLATSVQLAPLVTSSTGALTQPFSNVQLSTSGYWAVTEPQ